MTGSLIRLQASTRQEAIRTVQKLHRNLGHPSKEALTELLAARGASEAILEAARGYTCLACTKYKKPAQAAPASMPQSTTFNDTVQADVFWLRRGSAKFPVMSIVDMATRYTSATLLRSEQTEDRTSRHSSDPGLHTSDLQPSSSPMRDALGSAALWMTGRPHTPSSTLWHLVRPTNDLQWWNGVMP